MEVLEPKNEIVYEDLEDGFRDQLNTVDKDGKRIWLYPSESKGKWTNYRRAFAYAAIAMFFAMPWIHINGHPFFLVNVFERDFIFFGIPFFPQDFNILALGLLTFFVFIMLFTVSYGRLWCGWACPQTLFMEHVFRRIEFWIEGKPTQQKRLNEASWNAEKIRKKVLKHGVYVLFSLIVSHSVMAYMVGRENIFNIIQQGPLAHLPGFIGIVVFTAAFYFVFSKLREQVCTVICPYGRLQGVLLGKDSMVVAYDYIRGEKRTRKKKAATDGDCVDCNACVRVCPTGIDIRNGTQLECINCTACIDACDSIMDKLGRDRGLISFASENSIKERKPFRFTTRMAGYSVVLVILVSLVAGLLITRSDIEATVNRVPGQLYQKSEDGQTISNLYNVKLINKTFDEKEIDLRLSGIEGGVIRMNGNKPILEKGKAGQSIIFVDIPRDQLDGLKTKIYVDVFANGEKVETASTNFMGPNN